MEKPEISEFLKLDFNIDPKSEIEKKLSFPNSKIKRLVFREKFGFFYEFRFKTTFEYLGKKEEIINRIFIFNGKPIKGDLSDYVVVEGSEDEIKIPDYKNSYFLAKEELKKRVQEKTNTISKMLLKNLEKERLRIEKEFVSETTDFQSHLKEIAEKLMEYAKKGDLEKISREKKLLDSIKEKSNFSELEKDKERAIQLETQKHMLNVENKVDKMGVIYYPIYVFTIDLEKDKIKKTFIFEFDPMSEEIKGLNCESCGNLVKEMFLCEGGHSVCKRCSSMCESCEKLYCKKCIKYSCEICSKKICKNCAVRCFRCSKLVCVGHTRKDKLSGYSYCNNCLKRCEKCDELKDPFSFKVSKKTNREICEDCFRNEAREKVLKGVFKE